MFFESTIMIPIVCLVAIAAGVALQQGFSNPYVSYAVVCLVLGGHKH